jgi:uncharacterized protein (TIGR02145 family)
MNTKLFYLIGFLLLVSGSIHAQSKKAVVIQRDSVKDSRDEHVYKMVKIGSKFWMCENLRWQTEGSYVYEDNAKNDKKYGRMYSYEVSRSACPTGTHLPTKMDWDSLEIAVDPKGQGEAADKLLKKTAPFFNATVGGLRTSKEKFAAIESEGWYWGDDNSIYLSKESGGGTLNINKKIEKKDMKSAYYIRCIKD